MILWFNCKITDVRLNPGLNNRHNLRTDSRFDVARYTFASWIPLEPLVSKFIFHLDLAEFAHRQQEMQDWLEQIFPVEKLIIHWHRCCAAEEWITAAAEIMGIDDELVFPAGNEDHVFMDSDIAIFQRGLELVAQDPDPDATFMTSHYPESIRYGHNLGAELTDCGDFIHYQDRSNVALRVMKKNMFLWYVDQINRVGITAESQYCSRTECLDNYGIIPINKIYAPTKELFRHYDGYFHVGIGPETVPPIEIPPGFFTGMKIRYGYTDREAGAVNINPLSHSLYAADNSGADYRFTLGDMPAFWKTFIHEISIAPGGDTHELQAARDQHYIARTTVNLGSYQGDFSQDNLPPVHWLKNHMLVLEV